MAKILILGLGNPILSDDGIGIEIAHRIEDKLKDHTSCFAWEPDEDIDVIEASIGGLAILDLIVGYEKLIVIDAIKTKKGNPGTLYKVKVADFSSTIHISSPHDVNFATAIEIGKRCGVSIPEQIDIYAIEIKDNTTFSEQCTLEVRKAVPKTVNTIIRQSLNSISTSKLQNRRFRLKN